MKNIFAIILLFAFFQTLDAVVYSTQPANGQDTWLNYSSPDNNYGGTIYLRVRKASDTVDSWRVTTGLVKFDLTPLIGATINSATFYMRLFGSGWTQRYNFACNRILSANDGWVAGTNDGVAQTGSSDWNYKVRATTRWIGDVAGDGGADAGCSQSGVDWSATNIGSYALGNQNLADGWEMVVPLNVSELTTMVSGNYGMLLHINAGNGTGGSSTDFYSANCSTETYRPKLVVDYTAPTPSGKKKIGSQVITY